MLTYRVDDMTCGHCASTITNAVRAVDAGAEVQIDLARHLVAVGPSKAEAAEVARALTEAGYTPVRVELAAPPAAPSRNGACCGCCS